MTRLPRLAVRSLHHTALVATALAVATHAQTLVRSVPGPAASAQYGKACIEIADQNGDGYKDLLVGAPGFNSGRGAVYCLSGAYLALGAGSITLWSAAPASGAIGDSFGTSLAILGDVVGSSAADFAVGAPYASGSFGAIYVVDGSAHTVFPAVGGAGSFSGFGTTVARVSDRNGDGDSELAVGAPNSSAVYLLSGAALHTGGSYASHDLDSYSGAAGMGVSLASGFDLDGDGYDELAIGAPLADPASTTDAGGLLIYSTAPGVSLIGSYFPAVSGERMGSSVDAAHDYDGDGVVDIVVGAPHALDASGNLGGRVVVLSGARLVAVTPPYELYTLLPGVVSQVGQITFDTRFGATVCASGDLNNDGVGEILVGSPDYFTGFGGTAKGVMTFFSGATGARWLHVFGISGDYLASSITGAIRDLDADGFKELVVAGSLSDAGGTDSGVVKCYKLFPIAPGTYCAGKLNSLGCTPAIWFTGTPRALVGTPPFLVNALNFRNLKSGLLFYSHQPASIAFQGGLKCAASPIVRTPPQTAGGSATGADCTGTYSFDFNALIHSGADASLVTGAEVYAQYWARDPQSPSTTSLSNALRFVINP